MEILTAIGWVLAATAAAGLLWGRGRLQELSAGLAETRRGAEEKLREVLRDRDESLRRVRERSEEEQRFAHEPLARELVEVIDNFERALAVMGEGAAAEGVRLTHAQLLRVLERHGIERIPALGEAFDPHLHEAVGTEPGPQPEHTVVREWCCGYLVHGRVLRPARVVLAVSPPPIDEQPLPPEVEARPPALASDEE